MNDRELTISSLPSNKYNNINGFSLAINIFLGLNSAKSYLCLNLHSYF